MDTIRVEYITSDGEYKKEELKWEDGEGSESFVDMDWGELPEDQLVSFGTMKSDLKSTDTERERVVIASIHGWPEYKTEWRSRCISVFRKKMCTKVPQAYRRSANMVVYAEISYPSSFEAGVKTVAKQCAIKAAAAAAATAIATGGTGAYPVFAKAFMACLQSQLGPETDLVKFSVDTERGTTGDWKPI